MRRRPWVWIVGGTLVLLLGGTGLYLSQQIGDKDWWRREAEAYNRRHAIPDAQNAAYDYAGLDSIYAWEGCLEEDWKSPLPEKASQTLETWNAKVAPVAQASHKGYFFKLIPSSFLATDKSISSHPLPLQYAANLLLLQARREAFEGRPEAALDYALDALRVSHQADRGLFSIRLIGLCDRESALQSLQRLAMDVPPSAESLQQASDEILTISQTRPNPEEAWELETLNYRGLLEISYRPSGTRMMGDFKTCIPSWREWTVNAFTEPLERARAELNATNAILMKHPYLSLEDTSRLAHPAPPYYGPFHALPEEFQEDLLLERGTRLLLLLRAHRIRHGSYPESLQGFPDSSDFNYQRLEGDRFLLRIPTPTKKKELIFGAPPEPPPVPKPTKRKPVASKPPHP